ncbi:hypothetical protein H0H92_015779 [Tricholoma furcatifolium]|nr:hypothetical protein H0H92_015779 [Tricholoma furcatifolium]
MIFTKFDLLLDTVFVDKSRLNFSTNHDEVEKAALGTVYASAGAHRHRMNLPSSFEREYLIDASGFMPTRVEPLNEVMAQCSKAKALNVLWDIAQRFDPKQKVLTSINEGLKCIDYWRDMEKSRVFTGHTMKDCLSRIHLDIIKIWNFHDPEEQRLPRADVEADSATCASTSLSKTVACLEAYIIDLTLFLHELFVTTRKPLNGEIVLSTLTRYKETKSDRIHEIIQNNACSARDASKGAMAKVEIGELICRELQIDVERTAYSRLAEYCSLRHSVKADKAKAAQFTSSARSGPTKEDEKRRMAIRRTEQRIDLNQEQMERLDIPAFTRLRISLEDLPDEVMRKIYAMIGAN